MEYSTINKYITIVSSTQHTISKSVLPEFDINMAVFVITGLIGVVSNGLTIYVFSSSESMRKEFVNILLLHQSVVDFISSWFIIAQAYAVWDAKLVSDDRMAQVTITCSHYFCIFPKLILIPKYVV